jgi:hypothetical protein
MERNGRGAMRKSMAAGVWLGVVLGIAVLARSESNADDLGVVQPSSNGEEPAVVERTNGDAPPEVEVADAVATTPGELESAGRRPVIRFENANPRVSYGGLIERRMGAQSSYRERIRHRGVYSSRHAQPDISGQIRYSGAGTGRSARYHTRGRIRYDGVTRARDRARIATIRESWMGGYRDVSRFGVAAD